MKLELKEQNETLELFISGTVDSSSAPMLEGCLKDKLDGRDLVIFDLKELRYISSAGLRVLLATHKRMMKKGTMLVRNVNEDVQEILDITGFSSVLNME